MSQLVRCRACGYIIKERKLGEVCPACGLKRSVFQGYRPETRIYVLALSLACLVCAVLLGMMGKKLIPVIMRG